jgi:5'-3' exonuclease
MHLLIDADLVAFRCAASVEPHGEEEIAILRCDRLMQELLHSTESECYSTYLTGKDNFRKVANPEYKANRKDKEPPRWLQQCRQFLVSEWNAIVSDGCEADDLLGIVQSNAPQTMIASLDKDLLMIPGWHYNWLHSNKTYTAPFEGIKTFYKQMLIGDISDNIRGVEKIGKVKAAKLLDNIETEQELLDIVFDLYNEDAQRFFMNAQCLWIMQNEEETWGHRSRHLILPNPLKQEVDQMLDSMKFSMGDISMEPITNPQKTSGIPVNGELTDFMEIETLP